MTKAMKPPPRRASPEERARILDAARRAFLAHGFAGTTMEELARELGMSKKTLYRSFSGKEAMADALVSAKMAAVTSGIETIMADPGAGFSARARRALVVRLENPEAVLDGERASFAAPARLDLDGLGVRGLSSWRGRYLLIAGPSDGDRRSRLYSWDGEAAPRREQAEFEDFNPEGFFTPEQSNRILVLSDDGERTVAGDRCKSLKNRDQKYFRGLWLELSDPHS
jgi:AcrR family transcriptional regulator